MAKDKNIFRPNTGTLTHEDGQPVLVVASAVVYIRPARKLAGLSTIGLVGGDQISDKESPAEITKALGI